ncbi:PLP-dependent transferase [Auriculariales sp. MPI-PUGE-AT-0066]|nr:PLP-dependent transferase [Auriculariales sp. MPI-PUGE-AT-0066]
MHLNARYPAFQITAPLDDLRREQLQQLDTGETYVDWMGSAVFPRSLVAKHTMMLLDTHSVFGNTHSGSQSSQLSSNHTATARQEVLRHFDADPSEYVVVFTQNASSALKLVGESFPWTSASRYIVGVDSHNSVHGIRAFAESSGAHVSYYGCGDRGGPDMSQLRVRLIPTSSHSEAPTLLAVTGLSNVTNAKAPLWDILSLTRSAGVYTLLDAAALAPTSRISLKDTPVDAMAVSFYKMFGYPTGVGALIVKRSFLNVLRRPWFAGGTVDIVQVPGSGYTMSDNDVERFEDGTLNFLSIAAVANGLRLLREYRSIIPLRLSILSHWLWTELANSRYANGQPMVRLLSTPPSPLKHEGQESGSGSTLAFVMLDAAGRPIRNDAVEHAAQSKIALRAGCMCNPGAVVTLLHRSGLFNDERGRSPLQDWMNSLHLVESMAAKNTVGLALFNGDTAFGVLRISLGLGTNFRDVWNVAQWLRSAATSLGS